MDHLLSCRCGEVLVKSMSDGTTKVRSKIIIFRGGEAFAVCKGCGAERLVPLQLVPDALEKGSRRPKLFVSENKKLDPTDLP